MNKAAVLITLLMIVIRNNMNRKIKLMSQVVKKRKHRIRNYN